MCLWVSRLLKGSLKVSSQHFKASRFPFCNASFVCLEILLVLSGGIRDQAQVSVHSEQAIYILFENFMLISDTEFTLEKNYPEHFTSTYKCFQRIQFKNSLMLWTMSPGWQDRGLIPPLSEHMLPHFYLKISLNMISKTPGTARKMEPLTTWLKQNFHCSQNT